MTIATEFPDFDNAEEFSAIAAALPEFKDSSWHNDTCPSLTFNPNEMDDGTRVTLFVDFANVDKREFGDTDPDNLFHFVAHYDDNVIPFSNESLSDRAEAIAFAKIMQIAISAGAKTLDQLAREIQTICGNAPGDMAGLYFSFLDSSEYESDWAELSERERVNHAAEYGHLQWSVYVESK